MKIAIIFSRSKQHDNDMGLRNKHLQMISLGQLSPYHSNLNSTSPVEQDDHWRSDHDLYSIRKLILESCNQFHDTPQAMAFACLEALSRYQAPCFPSISTGVQLDGTYATNRIISDWEALRKEIDCRRSTLFALPAFMRRHFDLQDPRITAAYRAVETLHA